MPIKDILIQRLDGFALPYLSLPYVVDSANGGKNEQNVLAKDDFGKQSKLGGENIFTATWIRYTTTAFATIILIVVATYVLIRVSTTLHLRFANFIIDFRFRKIT